MVSSGRSLGESASSVPSRASCYPLDESEDGLSEADVTRLAEGTLAFFLADDQKKEHIRELFQLLAGNISANITDPARRKIYGRTLYGIRDAQAIEGWFKPTLTACFRLMMKQKRSILSGHCLPSISTGECSQSSINRRFLKKSRMDGSVEGPLTISSKSFVSENVR